MEVMVYNALNPPPHEGTVNELPSMTRQSEMEAADINAIVKKYHTSGVLPADRQAGIYADISQMGDYRTAVAQVEIAQEMFMQLPSEVRAEFDNDAAFFLDYVSDKENEAELVKMGLVEAPEAPVDPEGEAVADPATPVPPTGP